MIDEIKSDRIALFTSAGLLSWAVSRYLVENKVKVYAYLCDVGQVDEKNIEDYKADMEAAGVNLTVRDLKPQVSEFALHLIKYGAKHEGRYWNSTGALRYVLVKNIYEEIQQEGFKYYSHGCVGRGNDQQRFERYGKALMPEIKEFVPWDEDLFKNKFTSREDMVNYISQYGYFDNLYEKIHYSSDGSLIGVSHEGTGLEELYADYTTVQPVMSRLPWQCVNEEPVTLFFRFENGILKAINDIDESPEKIFTFCNKVAGENGFSLKSVFENRINFTKGRGIYESPGLDIIWEAFKNLLFVTLTYDEINLYYRCAGVLGRTLYQGKWLDPHSEAARAGIDKIAVHINGVVELKAYRGTIQIVSFSDIPDSPRIRFQRRFSFGGGVIHKV